MLDYNEIEQEIERLENSKTSYTTCEKLAVLYAVRNPKQARTRQYSYAEAPKSDFLRAVSGADYERVFEILDEHFRAIQTLYPKEYSVIIQRINDSKE